MNYEFITPAHDNFFDQVRTLIQSNGEVLVVVTRPFGPSYREYAIVKSEEEFQDAFGDLVARRSEVFVFCEKQLPIRGAADDSLLQRAIAEIKDLDEYVLLNLEDQKQCFEGDRIWELEAMFDDFRGHQVAFGKLLRALEICDSVIYSMKLPLTEIRLGFAQDEFGNILVDNQPDWSKSGKRTKLGGEPEWIQSDHTPVCDSCTEKMVFIAQIDSIGMDDAFQEYMFGDVGMIYLFYCFDCLETKSIFQCY
jgi:hypothetical protein